MLFYVEPFQNLQMLSDNFHHLPVKIVLKQFISTCSDGIYPLHFVQ